MDATAKKLIDRLRELEIKKMGINLDIDAIKRSLAMLGIKLPQSIATKEAEYVSVRPFREMPLTEACIKVLRDHPQEWLTKTQVEYFLVRGQFTFTAKDPKNSLDVTLRRLAESGTILAQRMRGASGNRYRWKEADGKNQTASE
jgi:hypothetical protein